jgi:hypothetical protein
MSYNDLSFMLTLTSSDAVCHFLCTKLNERDCNKSKIQFPNSEWKIIVCQPI